MQIPAEVKPITDLLSRNGECFIVGGAARDGIVTHDLDICTSIDAETVKILLEDSLGLKPTSEVGESFGVVKVKVGGIDIDIAQFRSETYDPMSRKPSVKLVSTINEDLARRDFTINAIAFNCKNGETLDPFGGLEDRGLVRAVGNPVERFTDDPLRMLRAVRFAARFGYEIYYGTKAAIALMKERLSIVSKERIAEELVKGFSEARDKSRYFALLNETELLYEIIPKFKAGQYLSHGTKGEHYGETIIQHTFDVIRRLGNNESAWVYILAMLHDIGKIETHSITETGPHFYHHEDNGAVLAKAILEELKMNSPKQLRGLNLIDAIPELIQNHMKLNELMRLDWPVRVNPLVRLYMKEGEKPKYGLEKPLIYYQLILAHADIQEDMTRVQEYIDYFQRTKPNFTSEFVMSHPPKERGRLIKGRRAQQLIEGARSSLIGTLHP